MHIFRPDKGLYQNWVIKCLLALSFFCIFTLPACHRGNKHSAAFYDDVFKTVDRKYKGGDIAGAKYYLDSIFRSNTDIPPYYWYMYYYAKSEWTHIEGKTDSNSMFIDSMINIMESYHLTETYPSQYANVLNSKGDHYFDENNLQKAFEFFFRSRMAARDNKDSCAFGNQSYHLGMVTYRQEKYAESISYFKESLVETHACVDNEYTYYRVEELYNNIGLAYTHLKEYDSALLYYNYALDYTESNRQRLKERFKQFTDVFAIKATGVILGNLAKIYAAQHQPDTAEQLLLKSISLNGRPGFDVRDAMYASIQLAELYYAEQKLPQTMKVLQELQSPLDTLHDNNVRLRWLHLMYLCHKARREPEAAMQNLENYVALKDSIDVTSRNLKQTDYGQLLQNQDVQYQVKLLRKDNELNRLYLMAAVCLAILTIGIFILVYVNYIRSKKNVQTLTLLNRQVGEQKQQLEDAMFQLRQSNNDKDRILHVVAHDLRNPINAIKSLIHIMQEDGISDEYKEMLSMMNDASDNSLQLISEILEFSGNTINRPAGKQEMADVNELAKQAVGILKFKADDKQQIIMLSLSPEPLPILTYPGKISRVIGNLVSNAIKFSPEHAEIFVNVYRDDNNALIKVKDSGIGIPQATQPLIFDTFTAAKRHGTSGEVSFGLGLSICKQIVEAAGGRIWFESAEGRGSTFFVLLPLAQLR